MSAQSRETHTEDRVRHVVVIGFGMVGHRVASELTAQDPTLDVTIIGEEPGYAYDRVALSSYVGSWDKRLLELPPLPDSVQVHHTRVEHVDRAARQVRCSDDKYFTYDELIFATGSRPFVPPVPGAELDACHVYRTIDDLDGIREAVTAITDRTPRAVVIGGGLLGLEAAHALVQLGAETTVVEFAPRLMPIQVDDAGGSVLAGKIRTLGVSVNTEHKTTAITPDPTSKAVVVSVDTPNGEAEMPADIVVFSAGIRPRDELAAAAHLEIGQRGGIMVDRFCTTSDPHVFAVGEVAAVEGTCFGLVAPGYAMAKVVADKIVTGTATAFADPDMSTKLKLLGVDVASFGDAHGRTPECHQVSLLDPITGEYKKLVVAADGKTLLGGILVGDAQQYTVLRSLLGTPLPDSPSALISPANSSTPTVGVGALDDDAQICSCNAVSKGDIRAAIAGGAHSVAEVKKCTRAGTSCGSCVGLVGQLLDAEGIEQSKAVCAHFSQSRAELFQLASATGISDFSTFIKRFGTGHGCEVCKPTLASIFSTLNTAEHVLSQGKAELQDTNDRFLANIQRNGSYSVVPRMPAGQVTPEQLIVCGEIARDFDLYVKVTGAQRIDMFGAQLDQLPAIWARLVDAGMESGQAYGKSLRAVKSCVGTDWCRYGQQDSVHMAVNLELRYRGLRSPHKLKMGVSGCARECAEARGKDVGVIATENGWNLYVGGNGGATPRHAQLLAQDLDDATLIRYIDRFIGFYVRTADRLQRTAAWIEEIEGGLEHIRKVVCEDSLGIAADLEDFVARHVDSYQDEWKRVLEDPEKLSRFVSFVNAPGAPDPMIQFEKRDGRKVPLPLPLMPRAVRQEKQSAGAGVS